MRHEIEALWRECFPNDVTYTPFFFAEGFSPARCAVVTGPEGVETAACFYDVALNTGTEALPFLYLHGGATFARYRGKGNVHRLLAFFEEYCLTHGYWGYLLHAVPKTVLIMEHLSVPAAIRHCQTRCVSPGGVVHDIWSPCALDTFAALRARYVDSVPGTFYWPKDTLPFFYKDACHAGAVLHAELSGETCYAVVEPKPDGLLIREAGCPVDLLPQLVRGVCARMEHDGPVTLITRAGILPQIPGAASEMVYFAHIKPVRGHPALSAALDGNAYFNLCAI